MQVVPLQAIPNQTVQVQLGTQPCTLEVVQYPFGLFITVYVSNELIIGGVICLNKTRIVRSTYLGFDGDLAFVDTQGAESPVYTGLGGADARWQLAYLTAAEIDAADAALAAVTE